MKVIAEADNGDDAIKLYRSKKPDVIVLDLRMPGINGLDTIKAIAEFEARPRILVYSNYASSEEVSQSFNLGALGFVIKDMAPETVIEGIRAVNQGRQFVPPEVSFRMSRRVLSKLSDREIEVLNFAAKGLSNKEIACVMKVTDGTVKSHISNILAKLRVADRTQAVVTAMRQGLIELD